ncbi:MAG TPA: HNH endonuclease [Syntrophales bacterium]|nr:HNH endonuclease [Syntrophales bacterium]
MRKEVRERILLKCKGKCVECGAVEHPEVDHIIPLARGGRHDEDNFQILCKKCNLKKGKGIDYSKYVKMGKSPEYIEVNQSILETDFFRRGSKFVAMQLESWHRQNNALFEVNNGG